MAFAAGEISTVSQVNMYIKNMFTRDYTLHRLYVRGEISNCKYHSSGHIYFTIKDRTSQLSCVMFASYTGNLDFRMQEGQSVIVEGSISVYEAAGKYQLYAVHVVKEGAGRLYEEYERLKKRLFHEGLFDDSRKKEIPAFVKKVGIVTASTGAVIRDICNIAGRRNPYVQLVLYPAKVQGAGAYQTIIEGIRYFEATDVDVIIIGRGGGSIEDLWAFNEEALAYVIADCSKPIVSAVGHETDTTIADYAADLRASTPSEAAELVVYDYRDFLLHMAEYQNALKVAMKNHIAMAKMRLRQYEAEFKSVSPVDRIRQKRLKLDDMAERLRFLMEQKLTGVKHQMALYIEELKGLSPLQKLQAGYAYVSDTKDSQIRSVDKLAEGDDIRLTFADGKVLARVKSVEKDSTG